MVMVMYQSWLCFSPQYFSQYSSKSTAGLSCGRGLSAFMIVTNNLTSSFSSFHSSVMGLLSHIRSCIHTFDIVMWFFVCRTLLLFCLCDRIVIGVRLLGDGILDNTCCRCLLRISFFDPFMTFTLTAKSCYKVNCFFLTITIFTDHEDSPHLISCFFQP